MPAFMSDREVAPKTHTHHCPFHGGDFDCSVFFCEGIPKIMCDSCREEPKKIENLLTSYDRLAGYVREKEAEGLR